LADRYGDLRRQSRVARMSERGDAE
jgi:hypothetical protein